MLILNDILIDEDIFLERFVCDITLCKGVCCIEGDAGAPLLKEELEKLEQNFPAAKEYLEEKNIKAVENQGFGVVDYDGDLVTPLVEGGECAFVSYKNGIATCAYERAFRDGKTSWRKPSSCYLYPIRISERGPFKAIMFHRWGICKTAFINGKKLGTPCYKFLAEPVSEVFGREFYEELCRVGEAFLKAKGR